MGYRSEVKLIFYSHPKHSDALDAWANEKFFPLVREHNIGKDEHGTFESDGFRGYHLTFIYTKWYSEYADVSAIEELYREFDKKYSVESEIPLAAEFIRIGEEDDDNDVQRTDHSEPLLFIKRSIVFD